MSQIEPYFTYVRINDKIKTIAVDFDGTCVDRRYPKIGPNVPNAVSVLQKLSAQGYNLILFTMRSGDRLQTAVNWFRDNQIPLYGIQENPTQKEWTTSPKAHADIYIDDAAFGMPLIKPSNFYSYCVDWEAVSIFFHL